MRDAVGAQLGLLVLPDPTYVTGGVGQEAAGISFPDQVVEDVHAMLTWQSP